MRAPCGIQEWLGGALLLTKRSHFAAWEQGNSSLDSFDDPLNLVRSIKRLSWIGSYIRSNAIGIDFINRRCRLLARWVPLSISTISPTSRCPAY
jgi:hypothetical protein